jgi:hypothetical protein
VVAEAAEQLELKRVELGQRSTVMVIQEALAPNSGYYA